VHGGGTGAAGADMTAIKGAGVTSIAYGGSAGRYVITLADKWNALLAFHAQVVDASGNAHWSVNVVSEDVASAKTITIQVWSAATTVAPALANLSTDEKLKFTAILSNTAQPPTAR